jgi:ribosomal protein S18 acetylase RimI-like enzyme
VRDAVAGDRAVAAALIDASIGGTAYGSLVRHHFDLAFLGSTEVRALLAEQNDTVVGLILYGFVAGAAGAGRIQFLGVDEEHRRQGIARGLVKEAMRRLARAHARFVLVELPDDPAFATGVEFLRDAGFEDEGRIRDHFRDGVDLVLYVRRL